MNTSTLDALLEPGQLTYNAALEKVNSNEASYITFVPWVELPMEVREGWAAGELAAKADAQQRDVEGAVQLLMDTCHDAAKQWWTDTETGEDVRNWPPKFLKLWIASKLMLCVSELGEAMEGLRKDLMDDKLPHHKMLTVEGADALIRICDLFGGLGLPMARAVVEKLSFNAVRPDHKIENRLAEGGKSI